MTKDAGGQPVVRPSTTVGMPATHTKAWWGARGGGDLQYDYSTGNYRLGGALILRCGAAEVHITGSRAELRAFRDQLVNSFRGSEMYRAEDDAEEVSR